MRQTWTPSIVLSDKTLSKSTTGKTGSDFTSECLEFVTFLAVEVAAVWFRVALILDRLCSAARNQGPGRERLAA
jgi:hypothetical protein